MPTSPASHTWASIMCSSGLIFILWHTWRFDRWRCFVFTNKEWFKPLIVWMIMVSVALFTVWAWAQTYVVYDEYYVFLAGKTIIKPWQLWSVRNVRLSRAARFLFVPAWTLLLSAHCEEFAYWGYLMTSIRSSGSSQSWLQSPWFKGWLASVAASLALLVGSSLIDTNDIERLQSYIFLVASCFSVLLALASVILGFLFPPFISRLADQGADEEVIDRLRFVSSLNSLRTLFRISYSVAFLVLSVDSMTTEQRINSSELWTDVCFVTGQFGIFISAAMSVAILLPRNMYQESLPTQAGNFAPMAPYNHGSLKPSKLQLSNSASPRQWFDMGDRLNVDRNVMATGMPGQAFDTPFANMDKKPRESELVGDNLPLAIRQFKGPLDNHAEPANIRIIVTSDVKEDEDK